MRGPLPSRQNRCGHVGPSASLRDRLYQLYGDRADLLVEDGVVTQVGSVSSGDGVEVLDADGLVALPGFVDLHTHLREPGREDAETVASGSAAAAAGGYAAVLAMANTSPVTDTAEAAEARFKGNDPGFIYARFGNPTVAMFEQRMALLEGAERIADKWAITRDDCDAFGLRSQELAAQAWAEDRFAGQYVPVNAPDVDDEGKPTGTTHLVDRDEGLRDTTLEKLAALKPTQARLVEAKKPLVAIDEELAMLSRALNGKTGVVE